MVNKFTDKILCYDYWWNKDDQNGKPTS